MKLILATNQTEKFVSFYHDLRAKSDDSFDYSGYRTLLFHFDTTAAQPITVTDVISGTSLQDYDGVYINGYLRDYELAAAVAICCDHFTIPMVNTEMRNPPSLSKLTEYAKLAAAGVPIPPTYAGTKAVLIASESTFAEALFPAVLKRADADRGLDNFLIRGSAQISELLEPHDDASLWILQQYVPNNGFYRLNYYGGEPKFCIFRSLEARPDGDPLKAHIYKPPGGTNARIIPIDEVPPAIIEASTRSMQTMERQIGGVDCLYDEVSDQAYVLEANYNPQIVTVTSFSEIREQAYIEYLQSKW